MVLTKVAVGALFPIKQFSFSTREIKVQIGPI